MSASGNRLDVRPRVQVYTVPLQMKLSPHHKTTIINRKRKIYKGVQAFLAPFLE